MKQQKSYVDIHKQTSILFDLISQKKTHSL